MVGRYGIQPAQAGENIVEIDEQGAFHAGDNELDAAILAHGPVANSRASCFDPSQKAHAADRSAVGRRNQSHRIPGPRRGGAARWRGHRALHRALPQGGDRRPGRCAAARAGSAPGLPARAGRPPRGRSEKHRRAGQADRRIARRHCCCSNEAGVGGHLPALQAKAPHQGPDCPRVRHRAAGRQAAGRPHAGPARRGPGLLPARHHAR